MNFRGINNLALDTKGRMAMPARYRDRLAEISQGQLVVTVDQDRCLLVYPQPEWEKIEEKLNALPSFDRTARELQRLLVGHATETEIDSQGRILLPTMLREYARLDKKIVLIGQGKKFEIWDEQVWTDRQADVLEKVNAVDGPVPAALAHLSL